MQPRILSRPPHDERTDVVQKMGLHQRHNPSKAQREGTQLEDLLQYPDRTAGVTMTTNLYDLIEDDGS